MLFFGLPSFYLGTPVSSTQSSKSNQQMVTQHQQFQAFTTVLEQVLFSNLLNMGGRYILNESKFAVMVMIPIRIICAEVYLQQTANMSLVYYKLIIF